MSTKEDMTATTTRPRHWTHTSQCFDAASAKRPLRWNYPSCLDTSPQSGPDHNTTHDHLVAVQGQRRVLELDTPAPETIVCSELVVT